MTAFQTLTDLNLPCDLCGGVTVSMIGGGWDNDRIICEDRECVSEIEFPTSTPVEEE